MKIYAFNGKSNLCGEEIRSLREKKRLSQEQLAARMQVEGVQINQKRSAGLKPATALCPTMRC